MGMRSGFQAIEKRLWWMEMEPMQRNDCSGTPLSLAKALSRLIPTVDQSLRGCELFGVHAIGKR